MATIQHNGTTRKLTPLLMKDFLVAQTLKGLKTQTRRLNGLEEVNDRPNKWELSSQKVNSKFFFSAKKDFDFPNGAEIKCPYGNIGDVIWVRENFYQLGHWIQEGKTKSGADAWAFIPYPNSEIFYEDNKPAKFLKARSKASPEIVKMYKRNSLFMPLSTCRLFLEITDIRPEQLQDITEEDAIAEGVEKVSDCYKNYWHSIAGVTHMATRSFFSLWISINGEESYDSNPWVWRIQFKQIPKPANWPA